MSARRGVSFALKRSQSKSLKRADRFVIGLGGLLIILSAGPLAAVLHTVSTPGARDFFEGWRVMPDVALLGAGLVTFGFARLFSGLRESFREQPDAAKPTSEPASLSVEPGVTFASKEAYEAWKAGRNGPIPDRPPPRHGE